LYRVDAASLRIATSPTQTIDITSNIRFASGLEAQYIVTETDGPE
jgi:hypothetical protein